MLCGPLLVHLETRCCGLWIDSADVESATISNVPARGIQECVVFSMEFNDSHVSGHVGFLPLLKCYDFHGFERIRDFHVDGKIYYDFHGLAPPCL